MCTWVCTLVCVVHTVYVWLQASKSLCLMRNLHMHATQRATFTEKAEAERKAKEAADKAETERKANEAVSNSAAAAPDASASTTTPEEAPILKPFVMPFRALPLSLQMYMRFCTACLAGSRPLMRKKSSSQDSVDPRALVLQSQHFRRHIWHMLVPPPLRLLYNFFYRPEGPLVARMSIRRHVAYGYG